MPALNLSVTRQVAKVKETTLDLLFILFASC
jgi:hypothetical protein